MSYEKRVKYYVCKKHEAVSFSRKIDLKKHVDLMNQKSETENYIIVKGFEVVPRKVEKLVI